MSDVLDILAAPPERDLPPGHLEQSKRMLLEAITASDAVADVRSRSRLRRIVSWLGCLLAVAAITVGAARASTVAAHADRGHAVEITAVVAAGSAISLHAAPIRRSAQSLALQARAATTGTVVGLL